jgi:hypothetical protein
MRPIGYFLSFVGAALMLAAGLWCGSFFRDANASVDFYGSPPPDCVWKLDGPCTAVESAARLIGARPYQPLVFWAGFLIFAIGVFAALVGSLASAKPDDKKPLARAEPRV